MNPIIIPNILRFLGFLLVQIVVLQQLPRFYGSYFNVLFYPMFILLLPLAMPTSALVALGFLIGIVLDLVVGTPGVHASAGAFSGFVRGLVIATFEPKGGFSGKEIIVSPEHFSTQNYIQISGLFIFLHLFWYFAVEQFTLVYFMTILLKTIAAWILTMIFVVIYGVLFKPRQ
jgi:hypothetical protein